MSKGAACLSGEERFHTTGLPFVQDVDGVRKFWVVQQLPPNKTVPLGQVYAAEFAAAARNPANQAMLPLIVEEMVGAEPGALAGTVAGAFLVELARMAAFSQG